MRNRNTCAGYLSSATRIDRRQRLIGNHIRDECWSWIAHTREVRLKAPAPMEYRHSKHVEIVGFPSQTCVYDRVEPDPVKLPSNCNAVQSPES